ncbi:hypothetical protein [Rhizosphaericola mali]|uniref:Uncharacterized protein n=1 Tax=Rhizosphaericola mali TaxID=2545455 RepID=A0A5P2GB47_9BACT|nr:hypothetical protein [Rhizosphaericola mali]QES90433.1 hypothetical protein E0W69_017820 [Rhizosphaericola mali]
MKHFFTVLAYIIMCATGKAIAQTKLKTINIQKALLTEEPFKKEGRDIYKQIKIKLNKGESLAITGVYQSDFVYVNNLDSLIHAIRANVELFKDSFSDPMSGKRMDILAMPDETTRVGVRNTAPTNNSYFVINKNQEAGVVKVNQDTLDYIFFLNDTTKFRRKSIYPSFDRYVTVRWIMDDVNKLSLPSAVIIDSIQNAIEKFIVKSRYKNENFGYANYSVVDDTLKKDNQYKSDRIHAWQDAIIVGNTDFNFQNYKNLFVPSFSAGFYYCFGNRNSQFFDNHTINQIGVNIESLLTFQRENGKLNTYKNLFLNIRYRSVDTDNKDKFKLNTDISLGYLIYNKSESLIDKNTFKFAVTTVSYKNLSIQPQVFFNFSKSKNSNFLPSINLKLSL